MKTEEVTAPDEKVEIPTIAQEKKRVCEKLTKLFTSPMMNERLMRMAGGDASRVAKNLTSFLSIITQDSGSGKPKKYYYQCSIASLSMCFLESMNMQLPFDSRQLVSMVIYDWEAELDISYKGFVNALNKHYRDAYVDAKLVFEDDEFSCEDTPGKAVFRHVAKNPFRTVEKDFKGIAGGYCYFSYTTDSGELISRIIRMSRADILKVRSKAKTTSVWDDFPKAMGEKALIRQGSKLPFAAIDLDIDIEEVANKHFILDKPESANRLELLMKAQNEVVNGAPEQKEDANTPSEMPVQEIQHTTEAESNATQEPEKEATGPEEITDADFEDVSK